MQTPRVQDAPDSAITERQLVRAARAGDRRGFAELTRLRIRDSFRLAAAILGNDADAADATQNALVAAWRELPRFRDVDRFEAWLLRIVVNECRMQQRQAGRQRKVSDDPEGLGGLVGATPATARLEALNSLERAFEELEPDDRILVVLHLLERRSLGEIAEAMHMPVGTARVRIHEARTALYQGLGA